MRIDCSTIGEDEYAPFYGPYIRPFHEQGTDAFAQLTTQRDRTAALFAGVPEDRAGFRYAPDKWTLRDVVCHISDAERIMTYRALRIARGDQTPLAGFDEKAFAEAAQADHRPFAELTAECLAVRNSTLALFAGLTTEALSRRGTANGHPVTVRALAAMIAGHELHHLKIIEEKYLAVA
jgi:hypothetical protein